MSSIIKFERPEKPKFEVGNIPVTLYTETDVLEDGSVWFRLGSQIGKKGNIVWGEWYKEGV